MEIVVKNGKPVIRTADGKPGRRIEWVGERSPMDDPFVEFGIAEGRFTREQESLLRRAALRTTKRTETNVRRMGRHDPGLSQDYEWGPGPANWVRVLSCADADILLSCPSAHEFRDLDAEEPDQPAVLYPPVEIRQIGVDVLKVGTPIDAGVAIVQRVGRR